MLDVRPGAAVDPVATVTTDSTAWSEVLFGGLPLTDAERAGTVRVDGDRDTVTRVVRHYVAESQA